jgi:hypothetical protein
VVKQEGNRQCKPPQGGNFGRLPLAHALWVAHGDAGHGNADCTDSTLLAAARLPAKVVNGYERKFTYADPQEYVWDELREKKFPNRFSDQWSPRPINKHREV